MRFRISSLVLGLLSLAALVAVGCGDDTTSTVNWGSPDDPEFQVVQEQVDAFVDSTLEYLGNGLNTLQGISAGDGSIIPVQYIVDPNGGDVLDVTYQNGWHVIYISKHFSNYATSLRDSVQFVKDGTPQQSPAGVDSLVFKHRWDYDVVDTTVTHGVLVGNCDYTFSGLDGNQGVINGSNNVSVHHKLVTDDSTVYRDITVNATVTNLAIGYSAFSGWSQCPVSGTVTAQVEMVYQNGDDPSVTTNWTVAATFTNGTVHAVASYGGVKWAYSADVCSQPQ